MQDNPQTFLSLLLRCQSPIPVFLAWCVIYKSSWAKVCKVKEYMRGLIKSHNSGREGKEQRGESLASLCTDSACVCMHGHVCVCVGGGCTKYLLAPTTMEEGSKGSPLSTGKLANVGELGKRRSIRGSMQPRKRVCTHGFTSARTHAHTHRELKETIERKETVPVTS